MKLHSRREFFKLSALTALNLTMLSRIDNNKISLLFYDDDEKICLAKFRLLIDKNASKLPIGELIGETGISFKDTKYVAGTLDKDPDKEELVINLTGLDCVTFVENCLVISRCIKKKKTTFDDYMSELKFIRYRNGELSGYASRLHYFSDWIIDNEEKGVLKNITADIGGKRYAKVIDFMSTHASSYKQLADKNNLEKIIESENELNKNILYYIPKDEIASVYSQLQTGDIIATTTSIKGLDVTHTGYVYKVNDSEVYFMHASSAAKKVVVSDNLLAEYVKSDSKKTGIMVARPLEV